MRIQETIKFLEAYGTSEGAVKAWDTRGRGTRIPLENSLGIPRDQMPQLADSHRGIDLVSDFLSHLVGQGHSIRSESVPASSLLPSQNEADAGKIDHMVERTRAGTRQLGAVIVSKDNRILDGHHDWIVAQRLYGADVPVKVLRVNMDIHSLMRAANDYGEAQGIGRRGVGLL